MGSVSVMHASIIRKKVPSNGKKKRRRKKCKKVGSSRLRKRGGKG